MPLLGLFQNCCIGAVDRNVRFSRRTSHKAEKEHFLSDIFDVLSGVGQFAFVLQAKTGDSGVAADKKAEKGFVKSP